MFLLLLRQYPGGPDRVDRQPTEAYDRRAQRYEQMGAELAAGLDVAAISAAGAQQFDRPLGFVKARCVDGRLQTRDRARNIEKPTNEK